MKIYSLISIFVICFTFVIITLLFTYTKPYDFEVEGDCYAGVNYQTLGDYVIPENKTRYQDLEFLSGIPIEERFRPLYTSFGVNDVHCNYKVKGQVPLKIIEVFFK